MGNKTISIDEICEGILADMRKRDPFFSFSSFVRTKLLEEYNKEKVTLDNYLRLVPSHYECPICKMKGKHWSTHCPVSSGDEEE
jgi:hypothetical protein